ncbi:hypothetical protein BDV97DRAFT_369581 [Delphinella strobiligena]|nr:hypothetical protein BDV97DRAFT_369581 [Delphinella strobiligena]
MSDNIGLSRQFPLLRLPPEVRMMVYDLLWYIPNEDWDGWESQLPGPGHAGPLRLVTPGYDATLYPKDQIKYEEVLSCIKKVYLNISCQKPSFINFLGQRVRKAVKDGKYREICCIEINLERTFPSLPPPVVVTMGDYTLQGGEASIEDNEPWLEGEPEYEWSMAVPEKVEALLAAQPQPLSFCGLVDRILDGECFGDFIKDFSKLSASLDSDYAQYDVGGWLLDTDDDLTEDPYDIPGEDGVPYSGSCSDDPADGEATESDSSQLEGSGEGSLQLESELTFVPFFSLALYVDLSCFQQYSECLRNIDFSFADHGVLPQPLFGGVDGQRWPVLYNSFRSSDTISSAFPQEYKISIAILSDLMMSQKSRISSKGA